MTPATTVSDITNSASTVSWGAVIAGAVASAALSLFLLALGLGIGFSIVSPWAGEGVSGTTFHVVAGVYLVATAMLASTVGGYLTGRLRAQWAGVNDNEVYFRDTAHGLVTWALATVLSVAVLGGATTHVLSGASAGLGAGASATAGTAAATQPTDIYVDQLLRPQTAAAPGGGAAAPSGASAAQAGDRAAVRSEMARLVAPSLRKNGEISAADRTYMASVVAARTGMSQADAERRVSEVITQAKKAADDARKAAAAMMLWTAAAMLAGAVAAMLGACEGGLLRDSKWYEPGWRTTIVRTHW